ncbi:hypothetical protein M514_18360 [Trichuris suis]|uniref:CCHC-type domain-containing protein n=2 Tax=Trichuris suis TaxID=68888 RepID=A0A085NJ42_9BILA|nr:hypothetical protein M514_18360 [Trichuris suis]
MGKNIEEDDLVAVMLCSLPDSYSSLITALEGKDEADLSVEYVSGKLLDEYQRRVESGRSENAGSEIAMKSTARNEYGQAEAIKAARNRSIKPEDRECYFCRKKGHIKVNCSKYAKTSINRTALAKG